MEDYELFTLPNGIRIVHKQIPHTQIAHCGIMLDIGSRDEKPHQQGLAHFWEHMAFKGTKKRKSYHILNRLENVGGELNAYTTKEKVCFHASLLGIHFEKATELLADIAFHSIFPEKQIERERNVVLEEMAMYYDSPEDALQDDFDQLVFQNHPLGSNILGTTETVQSFTRENLQEFIAENLDTDRIVFSSVSNYPFKKVVRIAEKYLADIPRSTTNRIRKPPASYEAVRQVVKRPITQAQCALGRPAFSLTDPKRLPFFMLINLLGGPGMNSRLNMNLRERQGLVYSIDASFTPFLDTGFLGIYFGTDPKKVDRAYSLIQKEMQLLCTKSLTANQMHQTKEQLMGQLAMAEEGNQSFMLMMAKSILDIDRVESLEDIFNEIRAVEPRHLQEIAQEMFDEKQFSFLTFVPED
ncbi:M16 family metallopeptidase [Arsenicibacter rosenii]|uniref:Peptidase M16 n=1 Tax=Arsenicibacter rosenii TaxID=1750698 RepID=A0A1S2VN77_9BACT|nr:pitrilysin family protein [Arsenicibacter rosenii]OIN60204.1 peptidase M16 [Arsenicibacter rosenii]